jgi:hypothetical protein
MKIKAKNKTEVLFKDIPFGQVFREDDALFMKVQLNDEVIGCRRCGESIDLERELGELAVELSSGMVYEFELHAVIELVEGSFIEE